MTTRAVPGRDDLTGIDMKQAEASFARHAAAPEVSVHKYVNGLIAEVGDSIADRHKIYLDTRYWIHLRDAAMGRPKLPEHSEILERVRSLVSSGVAICPVSDAAWVELFKQSDSATRLTTADLLDELSLGIAIMSEEERVIAELEHFITHPDIGAPSPVLRNRVWIKAGYILGLSIPVMKDLSPEENLLLQKASVDLFWQTTHREIAETAGPLPSMSDSWEDSAKRITADMKRYADEVRSIQQAFAAEIAGALGVFKDAIRVLMFRHFRNTTGNTDLISNEQADSSVQTALNMLVNAFRLRPKIMAQRIPSLYSYAMCHAAVRMDKTRKFNGHDLLDIHHASSGIPYHDAVFTETPLRVLVTAGNVALDKTFACAVLSKEKEVLDYLHNVAVPI